MEEDKGLENSSIIKIKTISMLVIGTTMKEMAKKTVYSFQMANFKEVGKMAKCKA